MSRWTMRDRMRRKVVADRDGDRCEACGRHGARLVLAEDDEAVMICQPCERALSSAPAPAPVEVEQVRYVSRRDHLTSPIGDLVAGLR